MIFTGGTLSPDASPGTLYTLMLSSNFALDVKSSYLYKKVVFLAISHLMTP
jgi:hypothetical protein